MTDPAHSGIPPSMDPDPSTHTPSAAPHVESEVVDSPPEDATTDVASYEGAGAPAASGAAQLSEVARVGTDLGLMSRDEYRALADRLILDEVAWAAYYKRCQAFAFAGMYGHKIPETVAAAGLKGMSLGMSFMEAIDRIKVIHGTPVIRGPAAINHIHERCPGAKCRCIVSTVTEATWRMERPGWEPKEFTFTMEQATLAGLPQKRDSAYKRYPARCLKWQAASEGAQEMFGDVLGGLYFQEELDATGALNPSTPSTPGPAATSQTQGAESKQTQGKQDQGKQTQGKQTQGKQAQGKQTQGKQTQGKQDQGKQDQEPPKETQVPNGDHPACKKMKALMISVADHRGANDETRDGIVRSIYNEALHRALGVKNLGGESPTLDQVNTINGYLEAQCSA